MKKLMFMINSLYGGGAEKVLQTLLNNIDYEKYDVTLYSMHREKIDTSKYPKQVHYKVVFDDAKGIISDFFAKVKGKIFLKCSSRVFYRLFIHEKFDVEIAFIEGESTKIISGSPNKKSKKIAWVHIDLLNNPWTDFLYRSVLDEKKQYQKYDKILCVSDSVKNAFLEKYELSEEKVTTQYNPIDRNEILKKAEEANPLPPKTKLRMIAVGRLVEQKGFDRLVRIVYQLKQEGFDFELYILGEGEMRAELEEYISTHELEDTVYLLGYQDNPYSYMATSDLIVCSSRSEGFSTVVSEAVVLGIPVVSTECAGVKELFGDYQCGVITENSEKELGQALRWVLSKPDCLAEFRKESIKRGEYFSLKKTMGELEELFDGQFD